MVSSTSDFGSAVSVSMSNPSIPSVISEASSVDPRDAFVQPTEHEEKTDLMSSDDTINPRPQYREEIPDEGYTADDPDVALNSDEEEGEYDDSSDSDGGLVMSRRRSATKAPPDSAARDRREAALSLRSKKSSRSGSSNTMKKVRSQDGENDHVPVADAT
jgi:[calcium/calmodulin-dependent protein kinase] kinase